MVIAIMFFLVLYLLLLLLIIFILNKLGKAIPRRPILYGGLIGYSVFFFAALSASLLVTSNESFWWYGPSWRFSILFIITSLLSLAALILGPVLNLCRHKRKP
jgi:hypothetical protein